MRRAGTHALIMGLGLIGSLTTGCGARPTHPVEAALYDDLRVIVITEQRTDWTIDDVEYRQIAGRVLQSVCQTPPGAPQTPAHLVERRDQPRRGQR
jgi:hypothetical protein